MPTVTQLIHEIMQRRGVQQSIVEKDYALRYLLAAIAATDGLSENIVLKSGTALKNTYFPEYRFSENLDFPARVLGPIPQIEALMETAIQWMVDRLNERGPFNCQT